MKIPRPCYRLGCEWRVGYPCLVAVCPVSQKRQLVRWVRHLLRKESI